MIAGPVRKGAIEVKTSLFDRALQAAIDLRLRRQGSGKRGGVRVIYFYYRADVPLYLLMVYAKARREDLSPEAKRAVQTRAARIKQAQRR